MGLATSPRKGVPQAKPPCGKKLVALSGGRRRKTPYKPKVVLCIGALAQAS